ncbi:MAG: hypothetical protein JWM89_1754 [Acidimicrobiales bacterium]|nr:hypothetical protein [Acidimicrobiales bacterium]
MGNIKPNRNSEDRAERLEWQIDQIRINTLILSVLVVLVLIGVLFVGN